MAKFKIVGLPGNYSEQTVEAFYLEVLQNGTAAILKNQDIETVAIIALSPGVSIIREDTSK